MARAYYSNHVSEFIQDDLEFILGQLAKHHQFAVDELQRNSWINQIQILKENLQQITKGYILFEYSIPRMGKRVDVILLINGLVLILEFKVGEKLFLQEDHDQVLDYALDLKNFHKESHNRPLIPILIATESQAPQIELFKFQDQVFKPIKANRLNISEVIITILKTVPEEILNPIEWLNAPYKPTPTIIEAAQALYQGHDVKEISRSDAGAINLSRTSDSVFQIIDKAKTNLKKTICFVTGVPGSGKTLAGLNIANERLKSNENEHAVFLSGNGPLVKVLREALIRDEMLRMNTRIHANERNNASRKVNAFIQNIHQFRDEALNNNIPL